MIVTCILSLTFVLLSHVCAKNNSSLHQNLVYFSSKLWQCSLQREVGCSSVKDASPFPGMTVRDFLGFPSLQEVECSGGSLTGDVNLLSLKLFRTSDNAVMAIINPLKNTCKTFHEFSSCDINTGDSRKSLVRTLVADLEEGETTVLGCNVTTFLEDGHAQMYSWFITVHRTRKW